MGKTNLLLIFMYMCSQICCLWSLGIFFFNYTSSYCLGSTPLFMWILMCLRKSHWVILPATEFLHSIAPSWSGRAQKGWLATPYVLLKLLLMQAGGCIEAAVKSLSGIWKSLCILSAEQVTFDAIQEKRIWIRFHWMTPSACFVK